MPKMLTQLMLEYKHCPCADICCSPKHAVLLLIPSTASDKMFTLYEYKILSTTDSDTGEMTTEKPQYLSR